MLRHIVLYKFKGNIPEENIIKVFKKLAELKNLVPGIDQLQWGPYQSTTNKNQGYNYGLTVDLIDDTVFQTYSPHPLHMEVREEMKTMLEGPEPLLMFDFMLSK